MVHLHDATNTPLRPPAPGRRHAEELRRPQGALARPRAETPGGAYRRPPARVPRLRGRDPGGQLRRGLDDRVGPRAGRLPRRHGRGGHPARQDRFHALRFQAPRTLRARRNRTPKRFEGERQAVAARQETRHPQERTRSSRRGAAQRALRARRSKSSSGAPSIAAELTGRAAALGAPERRRGERRASQPMLCALEGARLDDPERLYELKLDGVRIVADKRERAVALRYRHGRPATAAYPEIARAVATLAPGRVVLDGEIVAFDEQGRPSFAKLGPRMHAERPLEVQRAQAAVPVSYLVFDMLAARRSRSARLAARRAKASAFRSGARSRPGSRARSPRRRRNGALLVLPRAAPRGGRREEEKFSVPSGATPHGRLGESQVRARRRVRRRRLGARPRERASASARCASRATVREGSPTAVASAAASTRRRSPSSCRSSPRSRRIRSRGRCRHRPRPTTRAGSGPSSS